MAGYAGKILRVNLTTGAITTLNTGDYEDWGGGHGIGSKLFWDLMPDKAVLAGLSGFDPRNIITVMTSPLSGTMVPGGAARTEVQGIGAALVTPSGIGLLLEVTPTTERTKMLALSGIFSSAGVATGPTVGALIVDRLNWRWSFLIAPPVALVQPQRLGKEVIAPVHDDDNVAGRPCRQRRPHRVTRPAQRGKGLVCRSGGGIVAGGGDVELPGPFASSAVRR